jgi:hypothetical protein
MIFFGFVLFVFIMWILVSSQVAGELMVGIIRFFLNKKFWMVLGLLYIFAYRVEIENWYWSFYYEVFY